MWDVEEELHLAVIPDGNRRYAEEEGLAEWKGHMEGAARAIDLLEWAEDYPEITEVTAWALSPANYRKRSGDEIENLNEVYEWYADTLAEDGSIVHRTGIRVETLGDASYLSSYAQAAIDNLVEETTQYEEKTLNVGFYYDHNVDRDQALEAARADGIQDLDSEDLEPYYELPEVDILMRYGEDSAHLSGFAPMPQIGQATLHFPLKNWPDAERVDIDRALNRHKNRKKSEGA